MKKLSVLLLTLLFLSACSVVPSWSSLSQSTTSAPIQAQRGGYYTITAEEAKQMMDTLDSYILLDVRSQSEYDSGHIEGALLIPDDKLALRAPEELPDKDATILVYCRSGRRSAASAKVLVELGYTNIYDFGGINDWPYNIVTS